MIGTMLTDYFYTRRYPENDIIGVSGEEVQEAFGGLVRIRNFCIACISKGDGLKDTVEYTPIEFERKIEKEGYYIEGREVFDKWGIKAGTVEKGKIYLT